MKTYSQLITELDEATMRQRAIGTVAAAALVFAGTQTFDKEPQKKIQYKDSTGQLVTRTILSTKPVGKPNGKPFKHQGKTYTPYFPNLAHEHQ